MGWVLSGDPSQLPPVNDKELISKQKPETKLDRKGKEFWDNVPHVIQRWRCHRQQNDGAYAHMCLRLRDGSFSAEVWQECLKKDLGRVSWVCFYRC